MFGRSFRKQNVGQGISGRQINAPAATAARNSRLRVGSGMAQTLLAGIPLLRGRVSTSTSFWASLTSHVSLGKYNFTRLSESGTSLVTGTQTGTAFDVNGNASIVTPVVVRVFLDAGSNIYRFQIHSCS